MARWLEALQEYNFQIVHRQGQLHGNADAMSRKPCNKRGRHNHITNEENIDVYLVQQIPGHTDQDFRKLQFDDPSIGFVFKAKEEHKLPPSEVIKGQSLSTGRLIELWPRLQIHDGMLWRNYEDALTKQEWKQLSVPQSLREEILEEIHAGVTGGHLGEVKTLQQLKKRFYWPGNSLDVKMWCKTCATCASRKTPAPKSHAPFKLSQMDLQCR